MLHRPAFYWHFFHSRFAEALALCPVDDDKGDALAHYAQYRLGRYQTAAGMSPQGNWYSTLASIASLSACGRGSEISTAVRDIVRQGKYRSRRAQLASALSPYLPEHALELIDGCDVPLTLRAALLIKTGKMAIAADLLGRDPSGRYAEASLFRSNATSLSAQQKLACLNDFLASFKLSNVALIDSSQPPGAMNLRAAVSPAAIDGPQVSILMTAFRAVPRITAALQSLQHQTWRNLEIIVIDDASDDDTGAVVQAMAEQDKRIRYLRLPCNAGTYVAKNIGLLHANSDLVTCHDADDWAHPERIERQVRPLLQDNHLVATTSHWIRIQDDGTYHARPVHPLMRLNPASPMFRKSLVTRHAGTWDCVRTGADSELHARLKLVFGQKAVRRIPLPLTIGAHRPGSLMTASTTGYDDKGMSPTRLAYWESWAQWHIASLRSDTKPVLPRPGMPRCFPVPPEIDVPAELILTCLATAAP